MAASDPALPDTLAIAFVVESSVAIADEWHRIIQEYIGIMVKRLLDTNPKYKVSRLMSSFRKGIILISAGSYGLRVLRKCRHFSFAFAMQKIF